jgi:hypothetical protein
MTFKGHEVWCLWAMGLLTASFFVKVVLKLNSTELVIFLLCYEEFIDLQYTRV